MKEILKQLVKKRFPCGIDSSFAYGSAIFKQKGDIKQDSNMIDMILVVNDPEKWHKENLKINPNDYSLIRHFGSKFISYVGNRTSSGILYNPMIKYENLLFKYGVISRSKLIDDLTNWSHLFVAGRLQKPVMWLKNSKFVDEALELNLQYALSVALLLQPQEFKDKKLYQDLCGLSYNGDIRTYFGWDKNKSSRIVDANMENFRNLYSPIFKKLSNHVTYDISNGSLFKDNRFNRFILSKLPKPLIGTLKQNFKVKHTKELCKVESKMLNDSLKSSIRGIVLKSSTIQALKSFLTTSLTNSFIYSKEKFCKAFYYRNFN